MRDARELAERLRKRPAPQRLQTLHLLAADELERLADEYARLREALETYGEHTPDCVLLITGVGKCTCGLDALLSSADPR